MSTEEKLAIQAVLADIDNNPKQSNTCIQRWERLQKIHRNLPRRVRHVLRDFHALLWLLQKVLLDPNNVRAKETDKSKLDMQRLFSQGSRTFAPDFLAYIHDNSDVVSNVSENEHIRDGTPARSPPRKRKATQDLIEDDDPLSPKIARVQGNVTPVNLCENGHGEPCNSTGCLAKIMLNNFATPTQSTIANADCQPADEHDDDRALREAFEEIASLVAGIHSHAFVNQQGSRMAQLTTKPSPELEKLYRHAFGAKLWKPVAIKLQASNNLVASEFLQCIVWSFLILNVFLPKELKPDVSDVLRMHNIATFFVSAIEEEGADSEAILREAARRRSRDPRFHETEIDPEASVLARDFMLLLNAHLPQPMAKHADRSLTRLMREICRASLIIQAKFDAARLRYNVKWYSKGARYPAAEGDMERLPDQQGEVVAFTITPGLERGTTDGDDLTVVVLRPETVRVTDS